jgi:hypothetical protein
MGRDAIGSDCRLRYLGINHRRVRKATITSIWSHNNLNACQQLLQVSELHYRPFSHHKMLLNVTDNRRKTKNPPLPTARITKLIDWQATNIGEPPKNHHKDIQGAAPCILTFSTYETAFLLRICCFYNFMSTIFIFISK